MLLGVGMDAQLGEAGWFLSRTAAIAIQVACLATALTVLTMTAPEHGGSYRDILWTAPALIVVSAITLLTGLRLGRRRVSSAAGG